jgi:hypothetical protein
MYVNITSNYSCHTWNVGSQIDFILYGLNSPHILNMGLFVSEYGVR